MHPRWVTFDCFGTLVDWRSGFANILAPIAGSKTPDLIAAYHEVERVIEQQKPHRLYKEVLTESLRQAARKVGVDLPESQARALPDLWRTLAVFADVESMLAELRTMGCRLGVLTNCDEDLFAQTQRRFKQPFDMVVTAEAVHSYKPAAGHFQRFSELAGVGRNDWAHVGCSYYHDIAPAAKLNIRTVWLDRERTGEAAGAAARVLPAAGICGAIRGL